MNRLMQEISKEGKLHWRKIRRLQKNDTEAISGESRKIFCKMKTFLLMVWTLVGVMQVKETEGTAGSRGNSRSSFPLKDTQNLSAVIELRFSNTSCTAAEIETKKEENPGWLSGTSWSVVRRAGKHPLAFVTGSATWPPAPLSVLQEDTVDVSEDKPAFQL